jgi:5-(carboxyamino)imidazole ribonucleotide synthase
MFRVSDPSPRYTRAAPVVTMIGGGQLARMTHQASIALGQTLRVLAHSVDEPAAQVTPDVVLGAHTDLQDLRRAAKDATVVTFDHEHVPTAFLETLQSEGVNIQPPPSALIYAQDKILMRHKLREIGAAVPRFADILSIGDIERFAAEVGHVVLKAARGGYDGRGVWLTKDLDEARSIAGQQLAAGRQLLAEERVDMRRGDRTRARSSRTAGACGRAVGVTDRDGARGNRGARCRAIRDAGRPVVGQRAGDASA